MRKIKVKSGHMVQKTLVDMKPMPKLKTKKYTQLDGSKKELIEKVGDGSIIVRFDKTALPVQSTDVVCPHFVELKWAYGCPYSCSWCYLQGTYRWPQFKKHGSNISPVIKNEEKIAEHLEIISLNGYREILNSGELADSLMQGWLPEFLMDKNLGKNKVLFLTKGDNVDFLVENSHKLKDKIIMSFTFNAFEVSKKWEKGAPTVDKRIEAARKVSEEGYITRIRIDPMVPIENWEMHYKDLIDKVFEKFTPERITVGSLRGLQSTINLAKDKSWTEYLSERSNWGKKIPLEKRVEMYSLVMDHLKDNYNYEKVAFCKETVEIWEMLGLDYKKIRCNCTL